MKVLGIDPGSVFCGYGVIDINGKTLSVIEYGTIEVKKKTDYFPARMKEIYNRIGAVIERTYPDTAAIEAAFYSKNAQSLIKLTMAKSAAILAITNKNIDIKEYSAKEVKRSVTGRGNASKEQVSFMIKAMLNITESAEYYDTTDALAIAVCHYNNILRGINLPKRNNNRTPKTSSWEKFLQENPDKIVKL